MRKDREKESPSKLVAQSAVIATNSGSIVGLRLALLWSGCSCTGVGTGALAGRYWLGTGWNGAVSIGTG